MATPVYQAITGGYITGIYGTGVMLLKVVIPDINIASADPTSPYYVGPTRQNIGLTDATNKIRTTLQYIPPTITAEEVAFSYCSVIL
jgi:hypothetical protein